MASSAFPSITVSTMLTHTGTETTRSNPIATLTHQSESKQLLVSPFAVSQQTQENANIQVFTTQVMCSKARNTGRWTAEEHRLFLDASSHYGSRWKKIAAHLQTRTATQVRTHALKYYAKVNEAKKTGGALRDVDAAFSEGPVSGALNERRTHTANIETGHWTEEEHDLFLAGVVQYGKKWKKIAAYVETRTAVQVRTHAQKYYARLAKEETDDAFRGSKTNKGPDGNTGKWTTEEHGLFLSATLEHGKDWKKISEAVKTRTTKQVRTHAQKFMERLMGQAKRKSVRDM